METGRRCSSTASIRAGRTRTAHCRSDYRPLTAQGATRAGNSARDNPHMAALGLREAAQQVGLHRSSIFRAIRAGRLSATRTETGDDEIDPAELFRVYPLKAERAQQSAQMCAKQSAQPAETDATTETI